MRDYSLWIAALAYIVGISAVFIKLKINYKEIYWNDRVRQDEEE